jgi:hypothetical protein
LDIVRIQDVGLSGADDPTVLEWAAEEDRLLLTHDVSTLTGWAYERISAQKKMPGVIEIGANVPLGLAIEHLVLLAAAGLPDDCDGQVLYLPL